MRQHLSAPTTKTCKTNGEIIRYWFKKTKKLDNIILSHSQKDWKDIIISKTWYELMELVYIIHCEKIELHCNIWHSSYNNFRKSIKCLSKFAHRIVHWITLLWIISLVLWISLPWWLISRRLISISYYMVHYVHQDTQKWKQNYFLHSIY